MALISTVKHSNETLLFRHIFRYDRLGDHVDEIKFDCPVCITHVEVGESGPSSDQQPLLKVFALDLNALAGARFAPLCSSAISVPPSGSHTYRTTEMVMTDHVVLRGRYSSIQLSLWGACEHNVQMVRERMEVELGIGSDELPDVDPSAHIDNIQADPTPYPWLPTAQCPIPTVDTLAPAFAQALQSALQYFKVIRNRPKLISENPPQARLKELMGAMTLLESVVQGEATKPQLATLTGGKPPDEELVAEYIDMALKWTALLGKKQSASLDELTVGLAGLACVNLLSTCRKTAVQLLRRGIVSTLMGIIGLRHSSSSMLRLAVSALDMLTQSAGVLACQTVLGWWQFPASGDKSKGKKADKAGKGQKSKEANGKGGSDKNEKAKQEDGMPAANGATADANGRVQGESKGKNDDATDVDMEGDKSGAKAMETGGETQAESASGDEEQTDRGRSPQRAAPQANGDASPGRAAMKKETENDGAANGGGPRIRPKPASKDEPPAEDRPGQKAAPQSLVNVMSHLVGACMGRQSHNQVVQKVTRLLKRFQACQTAARFQHVSEVLINGHRPQVDMSLRETGQALRDLVGLLNTLTHLCSAEESSPDMSRINAALDASAGRWSLNPPTADPCVVESLLSKQVLQLCAAVLHVPVLHMQHLKQSPPDADADGATAGASGGGRNPRQMQLLQLQQLQQQMIVAMKGLLCALMSTRSGVLALSKAVPDLKALVQALDPSLQPSLKAHSDRPSRKSLPSELAHWLSYTTSGLHAVNVLETAIAGGRESQGAVFTLTHLSGLPGGVEVASQLLALSGQGVPSLLKLLQLRNKVLESTMEPDEEEPAKKRRQLLPLDLVMDDVVEEEKSFAWDSVYTPHILLNMVSQPHADIIAAWIPAAADIAEAVKVELEASAKYTGGQDDRVRRTLKESQGYVQAALVFQDKGVDGLLELLDTTLPRSTSIPSSAAGTASSTTGSGKAKGAQGDNKAGFLLLRSPDKLSALMGTLHLLGALLKRSPVAKSWLAHQVYSNNGLGIMERALRCALLGMAASKADAMWAMLGGDSTDDMERGRYRMLSAHFMRATCTCLAEFVWRLGSVTTSNGQLLEAILAAHTAVCMSTENLAASVLPAQPHTPLLQARQALVVTLLSWMEHEWKPEVVGSILGVKHQYRAKHKLDAGDDGNEPQPTSDQGVLMTPEEMVAAMMALGDLFPAEWPQTSTARRAGALQPPSHMRQRAAIAKSLESCTQQFRDIIAFGAASENRMVRAALVRLCSKAAGLGGGMGLFLAQPLLEELLTILKGGTGLAEGKRVLEVIVPLAFKPAIKAALLDLKAVSGLAKYLHRLVSTPQQEGAEGQTCITMVLETLTLLCNPDIALNSLAPREQRLVDDCPTLVEASSLTAVLLACLPQLVGTANINMAKNIICAAGTGLTSYPAGRLALRQGALKWRNTSLQAANTQRADADTYQLALSWAARKLVEAGERFGGDSDSQVMVSACNEVSKQLEEVANTEDKEVEEPPQPAPAHNRFAMAVQAAKQAAGTLPEEEPLSHVKEIASSNPLSHLCDAPTQAFWRYARARAGKANLQRKLTKVDAAHTDVPPASTMFGEPLTRRKRPREVQKPTTAGDTNKKGKSEEEQPRSGLPPIPTILAPPRRRDLMRSRAASTSRPASMHVDEFQKQQKGQDGKFNSSPAMHNTPPRAAPSQGPPQSALPGPPPNAPTMRPSGTLPGPPAQSGGFPPFQSSSSGPPQRPNNFNPPLPQGPPPIRPLNTQSSSGFQPQGFSGPAQGFSGPSQGFSQQGSKPPGRARSPTSPHDRTPSPQRGPQFGQRQSPPRGPRGPLPTQASKAPPRQGGFSSPRGPPPSFRPPPVRPLMSTTSIPPPSHPPPTSPPSATRRTSFPELVASPVSPAEASRPQNRFPPADTNRPLNTPTSAAAPRVQPLDLQTVMQNSPPRKDGTPAGSARGEGSQQSPPSRQLSGPRSGPQSQRSWDDAAATPAAAAVDMEYDSLYDNLYEPAATPSGPPSRTTSGAFAGAPSGGLANVRNDGAQPNFSFSPDPVPQLQPERRPSVSLPAPPQLASQPSIGSRPSASFPPAQHTTSPTADHAPHRGPPPTIDHQPQRAPPPNNDHQPRRGPPPNNDHQFQRGPPPKNDHQFQRAPPPTVDHQSQRGPPPNNEQPFQKRPPPSNEQPFQRGPPPNNDQLQRGPPPNNNQLQRGPPPNTDHQPRRGPSFNTDHQLHRAPPSNPPSQQPVSTPVGLASRLGSALADNSPSVAAQQSTSPPGAPVASGSGPAATGGKPAGAALEQQLQQIIRDPEKLRKLLASQPGLAKLLKDRVARKP